jgi:hypothetical protein
MNVTIEFLNQIEGRPDWLGPWFRMPDLCRQREGLEYGCASTVDQVFGYASCYLHTDGMVDACNGDLTASQLLELATYACRVEDEVAKLNA